MFKNLNTRDKKSGLKVYFKYTLHTKCMTASALLILVESMNGE